MTLAELNRHFELLQKIEDMRETLAALYEAAHPGASVITGMPRGSGVSDKVGDLAAEIADFSARIDYLNAELAKQEPAIEAFIAQIDDDRTRLIFRLRFLRGLAWKEVSQVLGQYTTEDSVKSVAYRFFRDRSGEYVGPDGKIDL